jgi:predicted ATP-grasp superfamily ATP-dependent carboligase
MPAYGKPYLVEAIQRLVELYVATDRPVQAAERRQELEALAQPALETKSAAKTTE